nr:MAG TPA: hypothetical protein [Caudoviricetes sp.]
MQAWWLGEDSIEAPKALITESLSRLADQGT